MLFNLREFYTKIKQMLMLDQGNPNNIAMAFEQLEKLKNSVAEHHEQQETKLVSNSTDNFIKGAKYHGDALYPGQLLKENEYLASNNRRFIAIMQGDGNFVVYNSERPIWASGMCTGHGGGYLEFTQDGRVESQNCREWNTKRKGAVLLIMQNDGNLVSYDSTGAPVWASDTWCFGSVDSKIFNVDTVDYEGVYNIINVNGNYVDVRGASLDNDAEVIMWNKNGNDNQKFGIKRNSDHTYTITPLHCRLKDIGRVLSVKNARSDNRAAVTQKDDEYGENQRWFIVPTNDDIVKFICKQSGKVLDIRGNSPDLGTPLQQYFGNGTTAQQFKLIRL